MVAFRVGVHPDGESAPCLHRGQVRVFHLQVVGGSEHVGHTGVPQLVEVVQIERLDVSIRVVEWRDDADAHDGGLRTSYIRNASIRARRMPQRTPAAMATTSAGTRQSNQLGRGTEAATAAPAPIPIPAMKNGTLFMDVTAWRC